jgi:elongation factor 1-beta
MAFGNLETDAGIATLNDFLKTRSYIEGFAASQADVAVFEAVKSSPSSSQFPHAARWFNHISSFSAETSSLPGTKKDVNSYGPAVAPVAAAAPKADDEDLDLFGSDSEVDAEAERLKAARLAEYNAKKAAKPAVVAKSSVVLDIKPWDDTTDLGEMERLVRTIEMDGLLWGVSKQVAIGYGIKKLQITLVVEDLKVSVDELQEKICEFEDYVQSTDIQSFDKI